MGGIRIAAMVTIQINWQQIPHPTTSSLLFASRKQHVQQDMQIAIQARTSAAMIYPRILLPTISEGLFTEFIAL
jgi:hypothetical protein